MFRRRQTPTDCKRRRGSVFVEYLLLLTIVGIGVIVGLTSVRDALVNELNDLSGAIQAITPPVPAPPSGP